MRLPQRQELEIEPDLYERIEEMSIRSGRSLREIIQALISGSFPINPAEGCSVSSSAFPARPVGRAKGRLRANPQPAMLTSWPLRAPRRCRRDGPADYVPTDGPEPPA